MTKIMQTLGELIAEVETPGMPAADITSKIIDCIQSADPQQQRQYLFGAINSVVISRRRSFVRVIEQEVDAELRQQADPLMARRALIHETFWTPTYGKVDWLTATFDQHMDRAKHQRSRSAAAEPGA